MIVTVLNTLPWVSPMGLLADYKPHHAEWLHRQIRQHTDDEIVCFTNDYVPDCINVSLEQDWLGWWSKMEIFNPAVKGDMLYMDIDTIICGDLAPLLNVEKTTVLRDFYQPNNGRTMGSGLMFLKEADRKKVWKKFTADPMRHMAECVRRNKWGDQGFINTVIGKTADRWQDVLPGKVVSYKVSGKIKPPASASVMCFHGKPRPWQVRASWIPKL